MRLRHSPRHWQFTVVGMILCLLAALFAIEAKVAWFSPDGSPTVQISSAKLQPVATPKVAVHKQTSLLPAKWSLLVAAVFALTITWRLSEMPPNAGHFSLPGSSRFFPSLFFRPPPSR